MKGEINKMRFLPEDEYYNDIIPLNIIYSNRDNFNEPDVLTVIYKDIVTDQKKVIHITNPEIEVYIVKPQYRDYDYYRDWFEIAKCDAVKVHYRTRWSELAKIMHISKEEARTSKYIFGADIEIENYYLMQFVHEYHTDKQPKLSCGYLDIENDIITLDRFPEYGETPINLVTYVDGATKNAYTFILCKDDIPDSYYLPSLRKDLDARELQSGLYEQIEHFKMHQDEFMKEVHEMFDDSYGSDFEYHFLMFEDELELIKTLWKVIHACENDYIQIWNMPYDMQNLMLRPLKLGADPNDIIPDERINPRFNIVFEEDKNPVAHKRKHICKTYTLSTFVDDMVQYAGIRSGRGKLPSTKLTDIAQAELQDSKLDYSEEGEIRYLFYLNFKKAIIYNLKDVLLQYGIENKTSDMTTIYSRLYNNLCFPHQSFTTTKIVLYSFTMFCFQRGYAIGTNRNKFNRDKPPVDYHKLVGQMDHETEEYEEYDLIELDVFEEEEDDASKKKKKKYQGAFVMNPLYMQPTGVEILNQPAKYVHEYVADEDIGAEYPTAASIGNMCNETLVGKVIINDISDIEVPIYNSFEFLGDEREKYKIDVSNFMMDIYTEGQFIEMGRIFLALPDVSEVLDEVEKNLEDLLDAS